MPIRGTSNTNARGSTTDRRRRRAWLLAAFAFDTAKTKCRCYNCRAVLTVATLTVDRIIPGCEGGTYRRSNIRPACAVCNQRTGSALGVKRQRSR